ncbi:hypothetical protein MWU58_03390 [Flavobacteriaceae bacterium S0825]|uniref:hypothetical protein n=1 Tax=Gaetbulibacter sp. S0825 TaxID=2720084 RepID=UPI0014319A04|nr:hypothetical protein [Gaetbulibacter sp. S0825]MCK0108323.1 hypothetical protein [Flavobacteriaceae bacterium S0825]NIX63959.1 hypothetical protein [Gaetbulibacter sp. S0825]
MKTLKQIFKLLILTVIMSSFSQCSSAQKLQKESPTTFGNIYCKQWVSGMVDGPSGMDIFIEIKDLEFQPDSVYFREKVTKLNKHSQEEGVYVGRFTSLSTQKQDIVISSDSKAEYGNKMPEKPIKTPFELAHNECVISYNVNGKTKYYKLTNVAEIQMVEVPMSPVSNNN